MENSLYGQVVDLEQYTYDGRLTDHSDGIRYRNRDMIEKVKELGQPLTEEAYEFIIKEDDD